MKPDEKEYSKILSGRNSLQIVLSNDIKMRNERIKNQQFNFEISNRIIKHENKKKIFCFNKEESGDNITSQGGLQRVTGFAKPIIRKINS